MPQLSRLLACCLLLSLAVIQGCGPKTHLLVFSGSENKALEALIQDFEASSNVTVEMRYMGSLDIAHALEAGRSAEPDAVWPANRIWIEQGDIQHVVKNDASIMRSPIVLALKRPIADALGWANRSDLTWAKPAMWC